MVAYLDSSVVLRHVLKGDNALRHAMQCDSAISSELLEIECRRVLHRCRMQAELDDERFIIALDRLATVLAGIDLLHLGAAVKHRAMESFPTTLKTPAALHLASAVVWSGHNPGNQLLVYSHDNQFNNCAKALGFLVPLSV